ncbi:bifunctional folylpolyglutamate synthase/dihydrofolate synthase [Virgibacillus sediminis]|uniref:tetrahydrofolate synthase n=1 Tax=Virgibacillus sediminis TaxID=202260 RepID=A0ABV7A6J8_9BACI
MFKSFQEAEAFFEYRKSAGIKPGTGRIDILLRLLDSPQEKVKGIHVAGTNGKGSTVHFLEQALISNGYRTGVFTSPSLSGITGHMLVNGEQISRVTFLQLCNQVLPAIQQMDKTDNAPTEFEILTAIAFLYFSITTDIVLVEAGMGGREDTTNCFQPLVSIITNVAMDHMNFLGDKIEKIAWHKAGIIKPGIPAVIGKMPEEASLIIENETHVRKAETFMLGRNFSVTHHAGTTVIKLHNFTGFGERSFTVQLRMKGRHQEINASLALVTLALIMGKGQNIDMDRSVRAIEQAQLPGRFELVKGEPPIIIDGAHNPAGMESFLQTVKDHYKDRETHLIFAAFQDKDTSTMLRQAVGQFDSITVTSFEHPRAASADELDKMAGGLPVSVVDSWQDVLSQKRSQENACYFIAGSLHFIAEVRKFFLG